MRYLILLLSSVAVAGVVLVAIKHRQFRALVIRDVRSVFSGAQASVGPAQLKARSDRLVRLLSTFGLADARGDEIDQGSRLRWLAESVWFPYALVGDQVEWEPIDARSARATLRCDGLTVRAVFEIDLDGRISQLHAERYRDVGGGRAVLTSWSGHYRDYREFGGFRVPSSVEVLWSLPGSEGALN
jgi:hypothetical protein